MTHFLIVSLSRSGGKLLRTLLDGHPEVNALPIEHWNRPSKNRFPAREIATFGKLSVERKLATAGADHVERKLRRLHPEAVVADTLKTWRSGVAAATTLPSMYEGMASAYFGALGADPRRIVVNHCGSLCRMTREQIDAIYGEGRHLLTIRDPRAVFASMQAMLLQKFTIKHILKRKVSAATVRRHVEKLESVSGVSGYLGEFCADYKRMVADHARRDDVIRVRFEDLVTSPETSMRDIASRLGIRWDPALLQPTQLGEVRAPNSSFARRGATIHSQAARDWVSRISPAVRHHIEETLVSEMAEFGYEPIEAAV